jgi:hypothetical protein
MIKECVLRNKNHDYPMDTGGTVVRVLPALRSFAEVTENHKKSMRPSEFIVLCHKIQYVNSVYILQFLVWSSTFQSFYFPPTQTILRPCHDHDDLRAVTVSQCATAPGATVENEITGNFLTRNSLERILRGDPWDLVNNYHDDVTL